LVGFAAETADVIPNAAQKLAAKNADFIVANDVSRPGLGIGAERNEVTILGKDGGSLVVAEASKAEIADAILDRTLAAAVA
jgi:phosphopantothenoylcysteine decarboxylase/phosphopantothenate--cysteine ligase